MFSLHTGFELLAGTYLLIRGDGDRDASPRETLQSRLKGAGLLALAALGGIAILVHLRLPPGISPLGSTFW